MKSLPQIESLFASAPRPHRFVDSDHCSECAEHDETLQAHTPHTISLEELGNPGWDPVCFIESIDGFRYYMPAFVRLACGKGDEYYLSQFLFHLNQERIHALSHSEREAIAVFLEELADQIPSEIEQNRDADSLLNRIVQLRTFEKD